MELHSDDFSRSPVRTIEARPGGGDRISPGAAHVVLVESGGSSARWALRIPLGECSDYERLSQLKNKALAYPRRTLAGLSRQGPLLYSIYSIYDRETGEGVAFSNTCNTLVNDLMDHLGLRRPPLLSALRDSWNIFDAGCREVDLNDAGAVAYFKVMGNQLAGLSVGSSQQALEAWDFAQKLLTPQYLVSYADAARTRIGCFRLSSEP